MQFKVTYTDGWECADLLLLYLPLCKKQCISSTRFKKTTPAMHEPPQTLGTIPWKYRKTLQDVIPCAGSGQLLHRGHLHLRRKNTACRAPATTLVVSAQETTHCTFPPQSQTRVVVTEARTRQQSFREDCISWKRIRANEAETRIFGCSETSFVSPRYMPEKE